ncbi:MAG: hypothetical protein FWG88_11775 [Oscillospiraceae bacterium]|nr:hypothetical protein [Oscillospiraceae bacterium]
MKKKISIWRILRWIIIVVLLFAWFTHPMRKPTLLKKLDVLKVTPIGSSWDEVVQAIGEQDGWRIMSRSRDRGALGLLRKQRIGVMHIVADLGRSSVFISLRAEWGFDENEKLIVVYVTKNLSP